MDTGLTHRAYCVQGRPRYTWPVSADEAEELTMREERLMTTEDASLTCGEQMKIKGDRTDTGVGRIGRPVRGDAACCHRRNDTALDPCARVLTPAEIHCKARGRQTKKRANQIKSTAPSM